MFNSEGLGFLLASVPKMISNIMRVFIDDKIVTIQVFYYMPDYVHVINEFTWQTEDLAPKFPRSMKFIRFWHKEIDAVIKEAYLAHTNYWGGTEYINVDKVYKV